MVLTTDGKIIKSSPLPMLVYDVAWLPDASGLFFVGAEKATGLRPQLWFQPYPSGEPFKISNDLNRYSSLSVTADGKSFVTTQERLQATIYVGDSPAVLSDKVDWKLTPISSEQATGYALSWTAAGKLIQLDSTNRAYITNADGSNRAHLLESDPLVAGAYACGPGDMVVMPLVTEDNKQQIWRLNVANGELRQLGFGNLEGGPSCTPDGKWGVYLEADASQHLYKVSVDGGTPLELSHGRISYPAVSPDGASVAYLRIDGQGASAKSKFVVQKLEGCAAEGDGLAFNL
jgi:Tol biopolymer transport system component